MIVDLFVTFIYQPFLNLLVAIYWFLQQLPGLEHADMGVAVIIFTLALRLILFPMTLASTKSEKEKQEMSQTVKNIKQQYKHDPVKERQTTQKYLRSNRRVVLSEMINLTIQVIIALMLWRIFARGLVGGDLHLIYDFMPEIELPFDLLFLDKYDLSHPNAVLNVVQTFVIFLIETVRVLTSPYPITRQDAIRMQIFVPLVSFIIFSQLPAGKKLFVITTLVFSLMFMLIRYSIDWFKRVTARPELQETVQTEEVPITGAS